MIVYIFKKLKFPQAILVCPASPAKRESPVSRGSPAHPDCSAPKAIPGCPDCPAQRDCPARTDLKDLRYKNFAQIFCEKFFQGIAGAEPLTQHGQKGLSGVPGVPGLSGEKGLPGLDGPPGPSGMQFLKKKIFFNII